MKLEAETNGEVHDVEVRRDGDRVLAEIDGRSYELEVSDPEPGVYLFKHDGKITEVFVSPQSGNSALRVQAGGNSFEIDLIDPKRLRGSGGGGGHDAGSAEIRTAMPGKIVRILREPGAELEKGDGVLVVEAMKMQNELKAPKAGILREVRVGEGTTVAAGDVLAVID